MKIRVALLKQLAQPQTSWQLCILAAIGGVASATLVLLFTYTILGLQQIYQTQVHEYISFNELSRFLIPFIGVTVILMIANFTGYQYLRTGIPFVLHRLKVAYGIIPFRNTINQFFGSATAIASGFSVGQEGPAIHLGAACSSYIGNKLQLPYNAIRTLCACGIAAGISASFNTPVAAVIFVMEVILREYKIHIFIPVMIASIVGSMITQATQGPAHQFEFFSKIELSAVHYPSLIIFALVLGVLAFVFNKSLVHLIQISSRFSLKRRLMVAALITGVILALVPLTYTSELNVSGINDQIALASSFIIVVILAKIIMTVVALGLGIPGGVIGPILAIGAMMGVAVSMIVSDYLPGQHLDTDYALMGMAGLMAATLNAPLAALLAVMELSNQIEVIVPAMIVITVSCVSSGQFFRNRSVFVMQLEVQKLLYRQPPIDKSLQRIGILAIMRTKFELLEHVDEEQLIEHYHSTNGEYLLLTKSSIRQNATLWHQARVTQDNRVQSFDTHQLIPLSSRATLAEAYALLKDARKGGVCIYHDTPSNIVGVVSFSQIKKYLVEGKI